MWKPKIKIQFTTAQKKGEKYLGVNPAMYKTCILKTTNADERNQRR